MKKYLSKLILVVLISFIMSSLYINILKKEKNIDYVGIKNPFNAENVIEKDKKEKIYADYRYITTNELSKEEKEKAKELKSSNEKVNQNNTYYFIYKEEKANLSPNKLPYAGNHIGSIVLYVYIIVLILFIGYIIIKNREKMNLKIKSLLILVMIILAAILLVNVYAFEGKILKMYNKKVEIEKDGMLVKPETHLGGYIFTGKYITVENKQNANNNLEKDFNKSENSISNTNEPENVNENEKNITENMVVNIPYKVNEVRDENLLEGETQEEGGVFGIKEVIKKYKVINGVKQENPEIVEKIIKEPIDKTIRIGTKKKNIINNVIDKIIGGNTETTPITEEVNNEIIERKEDRIHVLKRVHNEASDFILLESNGKFGLVDAGAVNLVEDEKYVYPYLEQLGVKELEFLLLTHLDVDHYSYLASDFDTNISNKRGELLDRIKVKRIILQDQDNSTVAYEKTVYKQLTKIFNKKQIPFGLEKNITLGDFNLTVVNDGGFNAEELALPKRYSNLNSLGIIVEKNGYRTFLGGDIEKYDEKYLKDIVGKVDVMKMPHHGLRSSNTEDFLRATSPNVGIVTYTREKLERGQPEYLERFISKNNLLYANNGTIVVNYDDNGIIVTQNDKNININR